MQSGKIVEQGSVEQVLSAPLTEYTRRLVRAALEITVAAAIRSPDSSSTPAARSASTRMRFTGVRVRISAPCAVAERASASQSAPGIGGGITVHLGISKCAPA